MERNQYGAEAAPNAERARELTRTRILRLVISNILLIRASGASRIKVTVHPGEDRRVVEIALAYAKERLNLPKANFVLVDPKPKKVEQPRERSVPASEEECAAILLQKPQPPESDPALPNAQTISDRAVDDTLPDDGLRKRKVV